MSDETVVAEDPGQNGVFLEEQQAGTTVLPFPDVPAVKMDVPTPIVYHTFATSDDLRAHIFQTSDIREEEMGIPEWGVKVKIKGLTGTQRAVTMKASMASDGTPDLKKMYAHMVVYGVHHIESGAPIFKLADMSPLMDNKSGGVIERIAMTVSRISGLEQAGAASLEKN